MGIKFLYAYIASIGIKLICGSLWWWVPSFLSNGIFCPSRVL